MNTEFPKTLQELQEIGYMDDTLFIFVLENLAEDDPIRDMVEIAEHGISGGYGNFIYYRDTVQFFDAHETDILEFANEQAVAFGYENAFFLLNLANTLPADITELKNWLVWFTVEQYASTVYDIAYEQGEL